MRNGDIDRAGRAGRSLDLLVDDAELARRRAGWTPPPPRYARGYGPRCYPSISRQADEGCDFDFLEAGAPTPEPEIH